MTEPNRYRTSLVGPDGNPEPADARRRNPEVITSWFVTESALPVSEMNPAWLNRNRHHAPKSTVLEPLIQKDVKNERGSGQVYENKGGAGQSVRKKSTFIGNNVTTFQKVETFIGL